MGTQPWQSSRQRHSWHIFLMVKTYKSRSPSISMTRSHVEIFGCGTSNSALSAKFFCIKIENKIVLEQCRLIDWKYIRLMGNSPFQQKIFIVNRVILRHPVYAASKCGKIIHVKLQKPMIGRLINSGYLICSVRGFDVCSLSRAQGCRNSNKVIFSKTNVENCAFTTGTH